MLYYTTGAHIPMEYPTIFECAAFSSNITSSMRCNALNWTNIDMECSKFFDYMQEFKYTICPEEGYNQWTHLITFLVFITCLLVASQFVTWIVFALVDPFCKIYCCGKFFNLFGLVNIFNFLNIRCNQKEDRLSMLKKLQHKSMSVRCRGQDLYFLKYITDVLKRKQTFEEANDQAESEVGQSILKLTIQAGMIDLTKHFLEEYDAKVTKGSFDLACEKNEIITLKLLLQHAEGIHNENDPEVRVGLRSMLFDTSNTFVYHSMMNKDESEIGKLLKSLYKQEHKQDFNPDVSKAANRLTNDAQDIGLEDAISLYELQALAGDTEDLDKSMNVNAMLGFAMNIELLCTNFKPYFNKMNRLELPLECMVHDNNLKTLRYLFQNFPIIKDLEEGITYELCQKAILSNTSVMKLLMDNLKFAQKARVVDQLFDTAIQQGGLDIIYLFLETLDQPKELKDPFVKYLYTVDLRKTTITPNDVNIVLNNKERSTPLHESVKRGSKKLSNELLYRGADVTKVDEALWTPLHYACWYGTSGTIVEKLIEEGSNIHALTIWKETPLHLAARSRNIHAIQMLLEKGADKEKKNLSNHTTMEEVGKWNDADYDEVIKILNQI